MRHCFQKKREDGVVFDVRVDVYPLSGHVGASWSDRELDVHWTHVRPTLTTPGWDIYVVKDGVKMRISNFTTLKKLGNYLDAYYTRYLENNLDVKYIEDFAGWVLGEAL